MSDFNERIRCEGGGGHVFTVEAVPPLDFYMPYTLSLEEWLKRKDDSRHLRRIDKMRFFVAACVAASKHPWWDGVLRDEPRIALDLANDDLVVIFKLDNNGNTFLVRDVTPV
jgi:hypothetical protein